MGPSITVLDLRGAQPLTIKRGVKRASGCDEWLALERAIRADGTVARERLLGNGSKARAQRLAGSQEVFA